MIHNAAVGLLSLKIIEAYIKSAGCTKFLLNKAYFSRIFNISMVCVGSAGVTCPHTRHLLFLIYIYIYIAMQCTQTKKIYRFI